MSAELDDEQIRAALPDKLEVHTPYTISNLRDLIRELHEVKAQGYALLDNELEEGLFVLGCPVRDAAGSLAGILIVNGPTQRMKSAELPRIVAMGQQAAIQLAQALT